MRHDAIARLALPRETVILAGKVSVRHRRAQGSRSSPRQDSCIGAHAAADGMAVLTRDTTRLVPRSVYTPDMCRNIQQLRGAEPPATEAEIRDAALQFVRKVSGYRKPSAANAAAFDTAVDEVTAAVGLLLDSLTSGPGARPVVPLQRRRAAAVGPTRAATSRPGRDA